MDLTIRQATISDVNIISVLGITTCYKAYFELDPSQDSAEYCVNFFGLQQIAAELEYANSTFLIAELNGQAIGYAKLREGKKGECLKDKNAIQVQRIYLLEKVKGRNFGRALIEKCLVNWKRKKLRSALARPLGQKHPRAKVLRKHRNGKYRNDQFFRRQK